MRGRTPMWRGAAVTAMIMLWAPASAAQSPERSLGDGVYSEAQAERGAAAMERHCAPCHMEEEFTGTFLRSWAGATVGALYRVISATMPDDSPGSLTPQEYASVLAYIFSLNGAPAGQTELPADADALAQIRIEGDP